MLMVNGCNIGFHVAGLFVTDKEWCHPERTESTYEVIYVVEGNVYLEYDGEKYSLNEGDLIILKPHVMHRGFKNSYGKTSFYWLHFKAEKKYTEKNHYVLRNYRNTSLFREIIHFENLPDCPQYFRDVILAHILIDIRNAMDLSVSSKTASEILEWIRINAGAGLTLHAVSNKFGYNGEHISRILKKNFGESFKSLSDRFLLIKSRDLLCNTNYLIKEIASELGFENANYFVNFFKYHEKTTPSIYRNRYTKIYMNNK